MNDGAIERILREQNRWWQGGGWESEDQDLRAAADARFRYDPGTLAGIGPPGLYVLWGPRRVGKSVELKRLVARLTGAGVEARSVVYCSCEGFTVHDLRRLFAVGRRIAIGVEPPLYWLLDEVTAVPGGWPEVVKQLRDQTPLRTDCVVLTGSSARELRLATKALADRRGDIADSDRLMLPMPFRAVARAMSMVDSVPDPGRFHPRDILTSTAKEAIEELSYYKHDLEAAWENYLTHGGFPRSVDGALRQGQASAGFVDGLWDIVRGGAIRSGAETSDPQLVALWDRLVKNLGSPLNASAVARDAGFPTYHQVHARVEDLRLAFLSWPCLRVRGGLPDPGALSKLYFTDPLLAQLVTRRDPRYDSPDRFVISEQQLGLTLQRALDRQAPGTFIESSQVLYERTATGAEIDFVGDALEIPFESKYVDTGWKRGAQTMRARHGRGVMATRSILDLTGPVWAVPAGVLAWLLDS